MYRSYGLDNNVYKIWYSCGVYGNINCDGICSLVLR